VKAPRNDPEYEFRIGDVFLTRLGANQGGLDDALILLIEANIEMAKKADAGPAIQVLSSLREAAIEYKDESMPAEIRLIRKLLRTDDKDARRQLFVEAFTPKDKMYNEDGMELPNQGVDGRRFVQALRGLIQDFGNVDKKFLDQVGLARLGFRV